MTNDTRRRALVRDFTEKVTPNFTSEVVNAFQLQQHARSPVDFDLHFRLITMIALREGEDPQAAGSFPILRRALQNQRLRMAQRTGDYLSHTHHLSMQFIQARRLHLAALLLEEVLTTSRGQARPTFAELVPILLNLAKLYGELQRFEDSITAHKKALDLLASERQATPIHADAWHSLAQTYGALGQLAQAEQTYRRALELYRASRNPNPNDVADVLNDLGTIYDSQGRTDHAYEVYQEALKLRQSAVIPNYAGIVLTLNNLGSLHYDRSELEEAEAFYREALPLARRHATPTDQSLALAMNNMAQIEARKGHIREAVMLMEGAVRLRRAMHPAHHSEVASTLRNLAGISALAGQLDQALEAASEALDIELTNEQFPVSSKRLNARGRSAATGLGLLLLLMEMQTHARPERDWTEQVAALLTYKGNAEIEQGLANILHAAAAGELKDLLERRQQLQKAIAQARSAGGQNQEGAMTRWVEELQQVEGMLEKHPEARRLADELRLRTIRPESVRAALKVDEVLLNYLVVGDDVFAQVLHHDGEHHLVRLEATGVKERVEDLQRLLRAPAGGPLYLSHPELQVHLRLLYEALLGPIVTALRLAGSLHSLIVSGDSHLYGLPWDLLMREGESGPVTLLEQVSVRLIPTPRDLVRLHRMEELLAENLDSALLLGVQQFEGPASKEGIQERGADVPFPTRAGLDTANEQLLPRYRNLAGTRSEVERLAETFRQHGLNAVALLSPQATGQTLLGLPSAPSILHFSTHSDIWTPETARAHYSGSTHLDDPRLDPSHPFSRAVVVLDGYDRRSFRGVLRAWELASLNLAGTQLITFSSCDSGLGDMSAGRSVAGLSQAAFLAGGRRTITTLWPVSDVRAPQWMAKVYQRRLEGASWQEAVRVSKLEMLADEYPLSAWAPFVLNGLA